MYLTLKGCTGYLGHPLLHQEHRGVHEEQGRGFSCREGCFSRLFPVADSAKQEARLSTDLVPRACVRHSLLPCEQGKRKKTCPRPERSLGHDRRTERNRRVSSSLSPIFYLFLLPFGVLYQKVQHLLAEDEPPETSHHPDVIKHRRPGPKHPAYAIPASEWSTVVQRVVEQKEPLRIVAAVYGVSHETIRRIVLHVQKQRGQQDA